MRIYWFWGPRYTVWHSPYYWDYYPSYFHYWPPYTTRVYLSYIPRHVYAHHTYHYVTHRRSIRCKTLHKDVRRTDYEVKRPGRSFEQRNVAVLNKKPLKDERATLAAPKAKAVEQFKTTDKKVKKDFKPQTKKASRADAVKDNKVVVPKTKKDVPPAQKNPAPAKEVKRPNDVNKAVPSTNKTTRKVNPVKNEPRVAPSPAKQKPPNIKAPKIKQEKAKTPRTTKPTKKTSRKDSSK